MTGDIPSAEARRLQLPGHDTYRSSHLLYHDDVNRDAGVIRLNREALKAFRDTVLISSRAELASLRPKVLQFLAEGGIAAGLDYPSNAAEAKLIEYANYEHLKIAAGFELHLKARLLESNVVVHLLDGGARTTAQLARAQKRKPVHRSELFAVTEYRYNGTLNMIQELTPKSLSFSTMLKPSYATEIQLTDQEWGIIADYGSLGTRFISPGIMWMRPTYAHTTPLTGRSWIFSSSL